MQVGALHHGRGRSEHETIFPLLTSPFCLFVAHGHDFLPVVPNIPGLPSQKSTQPFGLAVLCGNDRWVLPSAAARGIMMSSHNSSPPSQRHCSTLWHIESIETASTTLSARPFICTSEAFI